VLYHGASIHHHLDAVVRSIHTLSGGPADRFVAAQEFTGIQIDFEQHFVPGGGKKTAEDLKQQLRG
jgi:hypothetical protein